MNYTIKDYLQTSASKEVAQLVRFVLDPIKERPRSPEANSPYIKLAICIANAKVLSLDSSSILICFELLNHKHLNRIGILELIGAQCTFWYLKEFHMEEGDTPFSMYAQYHISLCAPNSIERIRGMVNKALRITASSAPECWETKKRRKHEPSTKSRERRQRLGRKTRRFTSL